MHRAWLERELREGRSIESLAREVGKHPSTVAYWVNQHGLASTHAARHAARGPVDREALAALVEEGLTIQEMATALSLGPASVRHWLTKYGLRTQRSRFYPGAAGRQAAVVRRCARHGYTAWVLSGSKRRYRCKRCRVEDVTARRRRVKQTLIEEAGGRCVLCGYDRYPGALQFHHLDPGQKVFALSDQGLARSLEKAREEARKCVLICGNCHAESRRRGRYHSTLRTTLVT